MSVSLTDLNKEQRAFIKFHAATPAPHRWAWLDENGANVRGAPSTWAKLRAWRTDDRGAKRCCTIMKNDLDAVSDEWWGTFPNVSVAARAAILKAQGGGEHG